MASPSKGNLEEYRRKRDFAKTREPPGSGKAHHKQLQFVVQKHAASHLHFDFRLELDAVMKSWAVPKGPSLDPSVKRLAMQVEDHPLDYNTFEGTIPAGEYGGGTVMLWDRGTYTADNAGRDDDETVLRREYEAGKMSFTLHGERLRGSFALVRTRYSPDKPQWLLIKHKDEYAVPGSDVVAEYQTSVATGRTMEEIAAGARPVTKRTRTRSTVRAPRSTRPTSNRTGGRQPARRHPGRGQRTESTPPDPDDIAPMLASVGTTVPAGSGWTFEPKYDGIRVLAHAAPERVRLITRNAKDKSAQFPEIAAALRKVAVQRRGSLLFDGEIVALHSGSPARFQELQSRMHVKDTDEITRLATDTPASLIVFDLLVDGDESLIDQPWSVRRARLEQRLRNRTSPALRLSESIPGDGEAMLERARRNGWEGVIAKRTDAPYRPGARSHDWLKLKVEHRQEFVVGGYTDPRNTREHIGALLLGYYKNGDLVYAGHMGGGFTRASLKEMSTRLKPLARKTSPFTTTPRTNERAHWVEPKTVVETKFSEWTSDGRLRQPIYLGTRDDKDPKDVRREAESVQSAPELTHLDKVFFPKDGYTKGDLVEYYTTIAPYILPVIKDRPLVLKRFPNGISGKSFFQQNAPADPPPGVRVEMIRTEGDDAPHPRFVGGDLPTLLYTIQLGAISVDPWHARIQSLDTPDYTIIDLDPAPRADFRRVIEVARYVKEELDTLGLHAAIKTSGATGIHIYLPLPPKTSEETARLVAQLVATRVAAAHPDAATVERDVARRAPTSVYVDFLQNVRGKTVACAYSVRAVPGAHVSAPIAWDELTDDLRPDAFTIETMPRRVALVGDRWADAMRRRNTTAALRRATTGEATRPATVAPRSRRSRPTAPRR